MSLYLYLGIQFEFWRGILCKITAVACLRCFGRGNVAFILYILARLCYDGFPQLSSLMKSVQMFVGPP